MGYGNKDSTVTCCQFFFYLLLTDHLKSRLKASKEELERQFKILPKDHEQKLKKKRKLKALHLQKRYLERVILEKSDLVDRIIKKT